MRLYMTQDKQAQAKAPTVYKWFEDWLANRAPQEVLRTITATKL